MRKKIKESIGVKTFISMMILLVVCCIIIYGMVMFFLPKNYQTELESRFASEFYELVQVLEMEGVENNTQTISEFSIKNNASLAITKSENEIFKINSLVETDIRTKEDKSLNMVADFKYEGEPYTISATAVFIAVSQSYDVLIKLVPFIAITIVLISALGAFVCSRYFSKPLVEICSVAKRMTQLDMTWKCDSFRSDEIGVLAASLNEMSERLDNALNSLQIANEQLQRDIENERLQEQQRIVFFTSVSHELKTPITIIKGELEGMIYEVGEYKDRNTYLRHSLKTVEEMEKLVKEILYAARMGGSDFQVTCIALNISDMLKKCYRRLQGIAEDKNIEMFLSIQPDFYYQGDERLLNKAISNIISNAVSYSPKGAAVTVTLKNGILSVENTGIHISEENLEQIFQPFYRIDKSRNRNSGGSGLGLYIVKTVFVLHGIPYHMENTEQGVRFIVDFS